MKQVKSQSFTFVQARTNNLALQSPSNFLAVTLIPGTNMFMVPTNFSDGGWGLILNGVPFFTYSDLTNIYRFNPDQFNNIFTNISIKNQANISNVFVWSLSGITPAISVVGLAGLAAPLATIKNDSGFGTTFNSDASVRVDAGVATPADGTFIIHNAGANQTYLIWTNSFGGNGSAIMRCDSAGNAVFSPMNSAGQFYLNADGGSGIVNFNLVTVGSMWRMIPSSDVAAWHGGTFRRGQITNLWDLYLRTNIVFTEILGGSDTITLGPPSGASTYSLKLPITNGLVGQLLYNSDGAGALGWTNDNSSAGGSSLITNANQFGASVELTIKSGAFLSNMNFWGSGTNNGNLRVAGDFTMTAGDAFFGGGVLPDLDDNRNIGGVGTAWNDIRLKGGGAKLVETGAGNDFVEFLAPASLAASYNLIMPNAQGALGTTLTNDSSGNLGWWNPYFGGTNFYRFNPNQFQNNDVTNVNLKSSAKLTNILAYELPNSASALVITQYIGSSTNVLEVVSSNKEFAVTITSNSTFVVKSLTGRTNDAFIVNYSNNVATLMVRSNGITVASNVAIYPIGNEVEVPYRLFSMTNSSILTNITTSANIISNYTGTITLPANFWKPGKRINLKFRGSYFTPAGTPTWTNAVFLDSTMIASNLIPLIASVTGDVWEDDIDIVCINIGASGSIICHGMNSIPSTSGGTSAIGRRIRMASGAVTVDTTVSATLSVTFHPSATTRALEIYIGYGTVYP